MKRLLLILFIFLCQQDLFAQFKKKLDSLCIMCKQPMSDSEKVLALDKLANLYYTYKLNKEGDSVLHEELQIAEISDNNNLVLLALFSDAITNISMASTNEAFDKTVAFLQKGIEFSKSQNNYNYTAIGYIRLANLFRKKGQTDKALYNATQAFQVLPNNGPDSLKAIIYLELGNCYVARSEAVSAVRNFNNAFDIAFKLKSVALQCDFYHSIGEMYFTTLDNKEIAKDYFKKSLKLDKENNYIDGQIRDYIDLSRVTDEISYLKKAIEISDSFHYDKYLLRAKILMFNFIMVFDKNYQSLQYLENEPEVKESYINGGIGNYNQELGHIYFYNKNYDSALYYYKLAEYDFIKNFDDTRSRYLFEQIAKTNIFLNDVPNAIAYYVKSLGISKKLNNAKYIAATSESLSRLYSQINDFKSAFEYSVQAKIYNDTLQILSRARDIALLDADRETRKHEEDQRQEAQRENSRRDEQYMLISIVICVVFVIMLFVGMFPVSRLTIKMFGYFFFISLFEFIVMIIDNSLLAKAVHNEPLKLWFIKIGLIALLVPVQHLMEHNLIKFLQSRKLLEATSKFSFKKLFRAIKKPAPVEEAGIEEDTAVL